MDEETEEKTSVLTEPSDSLTCNSGEHTPDAVLEKIGMSKKFFSYYVNFF